MGEGQYTVGKRDPCNPPVTTQNNCICEPRKCNASYFCVLLRTNHHNHINSLKSRKHSHRFILPVIVYRQCLYKIQLLEKFRVLH